ncbi:MAG: acyl--CoA ligase [Clostridia bacterium]|nr:acyl--CoA ligase [Clostridia bacterium]
MDKSWLKFYSEGLEDRLEKFDGSAYEQLKKTAEEYPDTCALSYYVYRLTYAELIEIIDKTADLLSHEGLKKGDSILLALPNIPAFIFFLYAANKLGIICSLSSDIVPKQLLNLMALEEKSKCVITTEELASSLGEITMNTDVSLAIICSLKDMLKYYPLFKTWLFARREGRFRSAKFQKLKSLKVMTWKEFYDRDVEKKEIAEKISSSDIAFYLNVGSASGEHKSETYTNGSVTSAVSIVKLGLGYADPLKTHLRSVTGIQNSYSSALSIAIHSMLCSGVEVTLMPFESPRIFSYTIFEKLPNIIIGYPEMLISFMDFVKANGRYSRKSFSFIRRVISVGAAFPTLPKKRFDDFLSHHGCKARVQVGYGLTECLSVCSLNPLSESRNNSLGIPLPGIIMKIVDSKSLTEMPIGQKGEICVYSPTSLNSVLEDKEATDRVLRKHRDGRYWVHTGDIGHMDEDGFFYFDYTEKRCVKIGGRTVSMKAIEDAIKDVYGVEEVCAVFYKDELETVHIVAVVVPVDRFLFDNDKLTELKEKINIECSLMLPEYMRPSEIQYRASFPRSGLGDIDSKQIEQDIIESRS